MVDKLMWHIYHVSIVISCAVRFQCCLTLIARRVTFCQFFCDASPNSPCSVGEDAHAVERLCEPKPADLAFDIFARRVFQGFCNLIGNQLGE